MGVFTDLLDSLADKVQNLTGEKERRERVAEIKSTYDDFKVQVNSNVNSVNSSIENLNYLIKELNNFRESNISENIECLGDFLKYFGNVKMIGEYAEEKSACYIEIPKHRFIRIEDYIKDIDWSKDDVFINSFFLSPIGMKKKTQSQNLSMKEQLDSLKMEVEQSILELENLKLAAEQDKKIVELYILCVEKIITYIEQVVIPEMDVVEAFFQAFTIKNEVIANNELKNIEFTNNIEIIRNTKFQSHYMFIKNAFLLYVIACKIYNTPVLTNLFKGATSEKDLQEINTEKEILELQIDNVNRFLVFKREEA